MPSDLQTLPFNGQRIVVSTRIGFDALRGRLRAHMGSLPLAELSALAGRAPDRGAYEAEVRRRAGPSGFLLFAEIDHGAWLGKFDIRRRTVRWIFGNPLIAQTMIRHDITAGLFAPVEMLITEDEDGSGTTITYVRPSTLMAISENPPLEAAAKALDGQIQALIDGALQSE
jgi:uncharacterized protein (DUF302 family)